MVGERPTRSKQLKARRGVRISQPALCVCLLITMAARPHVFSQVQNDPESVVLVGAGDIANCDMLGGARATAALLDRIEARLFDSRGKLVYRVATRKLKALQSQ